MSPESIKIIYIALSLTLSVIWLLIIVKRNQQFLLRKSLDQDALLARLDLVNERIKVFKRIKTKIGEREYRKLIWEYSDTLRDIAERYETSPVKIERFTAKSLDNIATQINENYVFIGESSYDVFQIFNSSRLYESTSAFLNSVKAHDVGLVYKNLLDMNYIASRRNDPVRNRDIDQTKKWLLSNTIAEVLEKSLLDDAKDNITLGYFLANLLEIVNQTSDSHLYALYSIFTSFEFFMEGSKNKQKLVFLVSEWLKHWQINDLDNEYSTIAKIWTLAQQAIPNEMHSKYVDQSI